MTPEEIARCRSETRGADHVLHFNNAGAALMPDCVYDTVTAHLERERLIGGYEAKDEASEREQAFYPGIAALIGAKPDEIAYVENATRAWDMAFYSLPLKEGDTILTARAEYSSNYLACLQLTKRKGVKVRVIPDDSHGQVDVEALERMIDGSVKLISITHIPTHSGLINPAHEIGRIARKHGITYLLDACQSVGQLDVNVDEIGCDMLSATGRKFLRGPRGTGFLYVRKQFADSLEPIFIDLHSAEWTSAGTYRFVEGARRFENWECFYAGKLGLAEAARYAKAIGMRRIEDRVVALGAKLRQHLGEIPGIEVADIGQNKCAIVTFRSRSMEADALKLALRREGINVSVSSSTSQRLDLPERGITTLVRASPHYYNSEDEIARFCAAVSRLAAKA
jgi:selenocysteine lyase/cysteine desulfurase